MGGNGADLQMNVESKRERQSLVKEKAENETKPWRYNRERERIREKKVDQQRTVNKKKNPN